MKRSWFITGANGYLGGELCKGLHSHGEKVVAVSRPNRAVDDLRQLGIDCRIYEEFKRFLAHGDVVVHCGGKTGSAGDWGQFVRVNVDWTLELFELATERNISCFVYVSSVAALGYKSRSGTCRLNESSDPNLFESEFYGRSKWLAEQALIEGAKDRNTRLVILRPGLIYGHRRLNAKQSWLRRGVVVDPAQRVPLVHIDSFRDAVVRVAENPKANGVYFVVDDEQPTIRELNALSIKYGLIRYQPWRIGKFGFWVLVAIRRIVCFLSKRRGTRKCDAALAEYAHNTRRLRYSTEKLRSETGWISTVSLKKGLEKENAVKTLGDQ